MGGLSHETARRIATLVSFGFSTGIGAEPPWASHLLAEKRDPCSYSAVERIIFALRHRASRSRASRRSRRARGADGLLPNAGGDAAHAATNERPLHRGCGWCQRRSP